MIVRLVKMTFKSNDVAIFLTNFEANKTKIRAFDGCERLVLYRDKSSPNVFFTYSYWQSEDKLDAYRSSELFRSVWAKTKPLFDAKPQAWSVDTLHSL